MRRMNISLQKYFLLEDIRHALQQVNGMEMLQALEIRCRCLRFGQWENVKDITEDDAVSVGRVDEKY
jgi:hypothetical protein